jgi:hypothetical protein
MQKEKIHESYHASSRSPPLAVAHRASAVLVKLPLAGVTWQSPLNSQPRIKGDHQKRQSLGHAFCIYFLIFLFSYYIY